MSEAWGEAVLGRRGRKGKFRGYLAKPEPEKAPDDRVRTSRQPHRRVLPEEARFSEKAESLLGRMLLTGQLCLAHEDDDGRGNDRYEAGMLYAHAVGAYRSVIEAPRSTSGSGRGSACEIAGISEINCAPESCACLRKKQRYDAAFAALMRAGQRAAKAVARVAVHREAITLQDRVYLIIGLDALVAHFGLTGGGRWGHTGKAQ